MNCSRYSFGLMLLAAAMSAWQQQPSRNLGNPYTREDFQAGDESREPYQRASDLVNAMGVSKGDWVADVGAGAGYYAMRLSDLVGPEGKVFAEDISDAALGWLHRRTQVFDLRNVDVVKGDTEEPKLPTDRLAAVLVVDSYHHFEQYQPMLEHILHALKPDGRLVIADYSLREHRTEPRADQLKRHEIDPELVRTEIVREGFDVVKVEDPFVKRAPEAKNSSTGRADLWLMVARRAR